MSDPAIAWPRFPAPNRAMLCFPVRPQDLPDLRHERVDVVAHPALAELAEARQVAADLGGVDVRVVRQLLGRDRLAPHLLRLGQDLQVSRQSGRDPEREPLGAARLGVWPNRLKPDAARCRVVVPHEPSTLSYPLSRAQPPRRGTRTAPRRPGRVPESALRTRDGAPDRATRRPPGARTDAPARTRSTTARASSHRWQPGLPYSVTRGHASGCCHSFVVEHIELIVFGLLVAIAGPRRARRRGPRALPGDARPGRRGDRLPARRAGRASSTRTSCS